MSTLQPRPTSIRFFLASGTPEGVRIVEKSNWTGRAVVASRSQLREALKRDELARPGIYVLTGPGEDGSPRLYIGEADFLAERIKQHAARKDFWTRFVAFTSSDEGLNKALVRHLEARLVALAKSANQWELDNSTVPTEPPLSEADRADAEWFLEEMLVIYPILGIDAFETAPTEPLDAQETLMLDERGAVGTGRDTPDGFVVLAGSRARAIEVSSIHAYLRDLRRQLVERGVLVSDGDQLVFTQDYRFASPSMAAGVLVGGSANGRRAWKNTAGVSLRDLQDERGETGP